VTLVSLVIESNLFQFKYKFDSQTDGLAMGSGLSPLLPEIFMSNIEVSLNHSLFSKIIFYRKHANDIFCIFKGTLNELNEFINFLNTLHDSRIFTFFTFSRHPNFKITSIIKLIFQFTINLLAQIALSLSSQIIPFL